MNKQRVVWFALLVTLSSFSMASEGDESTASVLVHVVKDKEPLPPLQSLLSLKGGKLVSVLDQNGALVGLNNHAKPSGEHYPVVDCATGMLGSKWLPPPEMVMSVTQAVLGSIVVNVRLNEMDPEYKQPEHPVVSTGEGCVDIQPPKLIEYAGSVDLEVTGSTENRTINLGGGYEAKVQLVLHDI